MKHRDPENRVFTLSELATLVELPRRTVRYYIQIGLLRPPEGAGRAARYTTQHLDTLLEIRKWQQAGLSLERIRELLRGEDDSAVPPPRPRQRGTVEVWSHIVIDTGIELNIEPGQAGLTPEEVRELTQGVMVLYEQIRNDNKE